ncbi:MAG: hypothetical protein KDC71_03955 [Acidobacteria bacterium]|nr:hypothetical protein [Acidobacteriota bacterium]
MNERNPHVFLRGWTWTPHGDGQPFLPGSGRGLMWLWQLDAGSVVERPYRRGGMIRFLPPWFFGRARAESELKLHETVYRAGLPTVEPVGFAAFPVGLGFYRLSYFTAYKADAVALPKWLKKGGEPDLGGLAQLCAQAIRLGLRHPDLNLNNFCRSQNGWFLLDFDRAELLPDDDGAELTVLALRRMQRSWLKLGLVQTLSPRSALCFAVRVCRALDLNARAIIEQLPSQVDGPLTRLRWRLSGGWRR